MSIPYRTIFVALLTSALAAGCASPQTADDDEMEMETTEDVSEDLSESDDDGDEESDEYEEADEEAAGVSDAETMLREAADGEHRSEENIARNQYRNPVETLMFFGVEPELDVVEVWPGGGWYTEVLAPVVTRDGSLTAGIFEIDEDDPEDYRTRITNSYLEFLDEHREILGDVQTGTFAPVEIIELGEPESVQMVLTFRNLHNMYGSDVLEDALEAFYDVLEPGGVLGVVQHRAPEGSDPDETADDGYLAEDFVIEEVEAAGFVLDETSEINANPDDTADYEEGVWTLPPTLRGGAEEAQYYEDIGESDRMTLRFVKPDDDGTDEHSESDQ